MPKTELKVMTFNILRGGSDNIHGSRVDLITEVIRAASPDFVALQELPNSQETSARLIEKISQNTGHQYYASSHVPIQKRTAPEWNRVASLSCYPLSCYPLKETHTFLGHPAVSALCTIIGSSIGDLAVCNLHLNSHSEDTRLREIATIFKHRSGHEKQILLGDFNSISLDDDYDPETLEAERRFDVTYMLNRYYVDVASRFGLNDISTYPTTISKDPDFTKPLRIDYVFVSPSLATHVKDATVIKTPASEQTSDHYPFIASLE